MCGIAGIICPTGIQPYELASMAAALKHRGPDGWGYMTFSRARGLDISHNREDLTRVNTRSSTVGFAHRRLSIIDLSAASVQPMVDAARAYGITYNGEIYNYVELRQQLENLGYSFHTAGDTEVLLNAYRAWGTDAMRLLNGMWAFALLDTKKHTVVLSRDRFGMKPLYYAFRNNCLYFASEIKALLALPTMRREPNEKAVARFLIGQRVDDNEETFFEGIVQIPAGQFASISLSGRSLRVDPTAYWSIPTPAFEGTKEEAIRSFRNLFFDSVRIHLRSDVPVGSCLSGGLDSSSIVSVADTLRNQTPSNSFSHLAICYCPDDGRFSEKQHMEAVRAATGVDLDFVVVSQEQFEKKIHEVILTQDEPFGSASILAQWFVFERARQRGIKVMLDGQGADEVLGGYHGYFAPMAKRVVTEGKLLQYVKFRIAYERDIGPFPYGHAAFFKALLPDSIRRTLRLFRPRPGNRKPHLPAPAVPASPTVEKRTLRDLYETLPRQQVGNSLSEQLSTDVRLMSLPALLRYEDRNSMCHSVEARLPFLDHRLVDFAFTLPDKWKINGTTTKFVLREALRGTIPESIRTRKDKLGFRPDPKLTFAFVERNRKLLAENRTALERSWFDEDGLRRLLASNDTSTTTEFYLWRIVNTKLWARHYWGDI